MRERFLSTGTCLRDGEGLCLGAFRAGRLCWADLNELGRINCRIGQIRCWSRKSYARSTDGGCDGTEIGTISKETDHSSLSGMDGSCGNDVVSGHRSVLRPLKRVTSRTYDGNMANELRKLED